MRLNTFNDVAVAYDTTKPVNGKRTPATFDVRPIGPRKYKHQRIVKLDDDCYILSDGIYDWANVWSGFSTSARTNAELLELSPIVWRRDGARETVTITNLFQATCSAKRKEFLYYYLPRGLVFQEKQRKVYVNDIFVPKRKGHPWNLDIKILDQTEPVVFERVGNHEWKHISTERFPERARVSTTEKQKIKQEINAFYDWMLAMAPLLRPELTNSYSGSYYGYDDKVQLTKNMSNSFLKTYRTPPFRTMRCFGRSGFYAFTHGNNSDLPEATAKDEALWVRSVITTEDHHVRVDLAKMILAYIEYYAVEAMLGERKKKVIRYSSEKYEHVEVTIPPASPEEIKAEMKKVRARYTRLINRVCGFVKYKEIKEK